MRRRSLLALLTLLLLTLAAAPVAAARARGPVAAVQVALRARGLYSGAIAVVTETENSPATVGVPDNIPVLLNERPGGRLVAVTRLNV